MPAENAAPRASSSSPNRIYPPDLTNSFSGDCDDESVFNKSDVYWIGLIGQNTISVLSPDVEASMRPFIWAQVTDVC
ncbi:MAG: hypothetical protein VX589_18015 [Myxococcota bacterium]|nr:hypothetical protein [Myxococcota bacterium]